MPPAASAHDQVAKVEEAFRLLFDKPQRRDAAATLTKVAPFYGQITAGLHHFGGPPEVTLAPILSHRARKKRAAIRRLTPTIPAKKVLP